MFHTTTDVSHLPLPTLKLYIIRHMYDVESVTSYISNGRSS